MKDIELNKIYIPGQLNVWFKKSLVWNIALGIGTFTFTYIKETKLKSYEKYWKLYSGSKYV